MKIKAVTLQACHRQSAIPILPSPSVVKLSISGLQSPTFLSPSSFRRQKHVRGTHVRDDAPASRAESRVTGAPPAAPMPGKPAVASVVASFSNVGRLRAASPPRERCSTRSCLLLAIHCRVGRRARNARHCTRSRGRLDARRRSASAR